MPKPRCSYQLHIQLCESKPAIWRRIVVSDATTLAQLHRIIQAAMGWQQRHAYAFEIAGQRYGTPNADLPEDPTMDARRYSLGQLLQGRALQVRYLYDFASGWQHRVKLESATPLPHNDMLQSLPICIGGRHACPPENCGGTAVFQELLLALSTPNHPQNALAQQLAGADFDAKAFDLRQAQARVRALPLDPKLPAKSKALLLQADTITG